MEVASDQQTRPVIDAMDHVVDASLEKVEENLLRVEWGIMS